MNKSVPSQWIVNTTPATFEQDVFVRSREVPVIVDFWAPWCGPCRALAPVLEKLAAEADGKFVLVKANTDEVPEAATRFNVSGIPAVFAVLDEQIVDYFTGAMPEQHVRGWLQGVLAAGMVQAARRLEQQSPASAEEKYRDILKSDPRNADAKLGLARVLIALERIDEAQRFIKELEDTGFLDAEGQKLKAQLALRDKQSLDVAAIQAAATKNPDDLQLQYQLSEALTGAQQYEQALELLLKLVERDKKGMGQQARELMVQIFQALPDGSELASTYRRKLSLALY